MPRSSEPAALLVLTLASRSSTAEAHSAVRRSMMILAADGSVSSLPPLPQKHSARSEEFQFSLRARRAVLQVLPPPLYSAPTGVPSNLPTRHTPEERSLQSIQWNAAHSRLPCSARR